MTDSQSYPVTEREFLEDNIATVAFHLGQPGARLTVSHGDPGLIVDPGEVLKEISRRLSGAAQTAKNPQTAFNLGFRAAGGGCHLPPSAEALFQSWLRDGASQAGREPEEEIPAPASPAQARQQDSDIGILLAVLRDFEEAVGEDIDDTEGVVAQIEADYLARVVVAQDASPLPSTQERTS